MRKRTFSFWRGWKIRKRMSRPWNTVCSPRALSTAGGTLCAAHAPSLVRMEHRVCSPRALSTTDGTLCAAHALSQYYAWDTVCSKRHVSNANGTRSRSPALRFRRFAANSPHAVSAPRIEQREGGGSRPALRVVTHPSFSSCRAINDKSARLKTATVEDEQRRSTLT